MNEEVTKSIIVKGDISEIYNLWADFENFPKFMKPIKSIKKTGDRTSHWVVEVDGQNIEWDAETTTLEKDKRIAWNSTEGDVKTSGQVTFTKLPRQETQVTVTLKYVLHNGGARKQAIARLIHDPEDQLQASLRRFKAYAEDRS